MNDLLEEIKSCRKRLENIETKIRELRARMYTVDSSWNTRERIKTGEKGSRIERLAERLDSLQKQYAREQDRLEWLTWDFVPIAIACTGNCRNDDICDALIMRVCDGLTAREIGWKLRISEKRAGGLVADGMKYYKRWMKKGETE